MLQPKPDEVWISNEDRGKHLLLADQGNPNVPGKIQMVLQNVNAKSQGKKICTPNEMQSSRFFEQEFVPKYLHRGDNKN